MKNNRHLNRLSSLICRIALLWKNRYTFMERIFYVSEVKIVVFVSVCDIFQGITVGHWFDFLLLITFFCGARCNIPHPSSKSQIKLPKIFTGSSNNYVPWKVSNFTKILLFCGFIFHPPPLPPTQKNSLGPSQHKSMKSRAHSVQWLPRYLAIWTHGHSPTLIYAYLLHYNNYKTFAKLSRVSGGQVT